MFNEIEWQRIDDRRDEQRDVIGEVKHQNW